MFVKTQIENPILNIELNRPDKKNAFNPEMIKEITEAFRTANNNLDIRGVSLTGAGDCFCAGADLEWMKSMVDYSLEENTADSEELHNMFQAGLECEVPVVGFFQGYVMGGATGLAAICDVGIAHTDTRFAFSEVKIGLAPAVISPFVLNKMNANKATEFMLTGKLFSAEEALNAGLIEYTGEQAVCDEIKTKVLKRFVQAGPQAVRETKKLINQVKKNAFTDIKKITTKVIAERRVSTEGQEGLASFFEKRKASWV